MHLNVIFRVKGDFNWHTIWVERSSGRVHVVTNTMSRILASDPGECDDSDNNNSSMQEYRAEVSRIMKVFQTHKSEFAC